MPCLCMSCDKRESGFFSGLPVNLLMRLDREKTVHEYAHGQPVFYQGNPPLAAYCISKGHVKLYKSAQDGSELLLRLLSPGEIMGYRALLSGEQYAASAEAVGRAEICVISRDTFLGLIRDSTDYSMKVMKKLAVELRVSEDEMIARLRDPVPRRTAKMLMTLLVRLGVTEGGTGRLNLPFPMRELALMIGTSPETLSRTLHAFAGDQILAVEGGRILIHDLQGLESAARNPLDF